jgi:D-arabinose 1-dehydrogenase-like Zn-dependent alcohol dehydrogenase
VKAAVVAAAGVPWELRELPVPEPGPGQVLVRVRACGLCHNDVWLTNGVFPLPPLDPVVVGHEAVGEVVAVGAGVTSRQPGDRVGTTWVQATCGRCAACRQGTPLSGQVAMNCPAPVLSGMTAPGGHAEYVAVTAASTVLIPAVISDVQAAPLMCAGYTAWSALQAADPRPGERVAVLGIGGLGHLALQLARACGFETVAITSSADKADLARGFGAGIVLGSGAELRDAGGADIVLAMSTSYPAATAAVAGLRPGGRLVLAAIDPEGVLPIGPASGLWANGLRVIGATHGGLHHLEQVLDLAARGTVTAAAEVFPAKRVADAVAKTAKNEVRFRAVVTY